MHILALYAFKLGALMTRKQRRLTFLTAAMAVLIVAVGLVLTALQETLMFFYSPSDLERGGPQANEAFRLGGLVKEGSVEQMGDGVIAFTVTDLAANIPVQYKGILPDLFREGQGVVTQGRLNDSGIFVADEVLAKHDENYMPAEVADVLKESGQWQGEAEAP